MLLVFLLNYFVMFYFSSYLFLVHCTPVSLVKFMFSELLVLPVVVLRN